MMITIKRISEVKAACGLSKSTIYMRVKDGLFTSPVKLGGRAAGWPASEIDSINAARIAGKNNDEIRLLVQKLLSARRFEI
jgi:prophage regulatory protein